MASNGPFMDNNHFNAHSNAHLYIYRRFSIVMFDYQRVNISTFLKKTNGKNLWKTPPFFPISAFGTSPAGTNNAKVKDIVDLRKFLSQDGRDVAANMGGQFLCQ